LVIALYEKVRPLSPFHLALQTALMRRRAEQVQRVKNKWKVTLKDGLVSVNGKEYLFAKCQGYVLLFFRGEQHLLNFEFDAVSSSGEKGELSSACGVVRVPFPYPTCSRPRRSLRNAASFPCSLRLVDLRPLVSLLPLSSHLVPLLPRQ
jgi:hypothetical protein